MTELRVSDSKFQRANMLPVTAGGLPGSRVVYYQLPPPRRESREAIKLIFDHSGINNEPIPEGVKRTRTPATYLKVTPGGSKENSKTYDEGYLCLQEENGGGEQSNEPARKRQRQRADKCPSCRQTTPRSAMGRMPFVDTGGVPMTAICVVCKESIGFADMRVYSKCNHTACIGCVEKMRQLCD